MQETALAHWLLTAAGKTSSVSLPSSPKLNTTLYTITRRERTCLTGEEEDNSERVEEELGGLNFPEIS